MFFFLRSNKRKINVIYRYLEFDGVLYGFNNDRINLTVR